MRLPTGGVLTGGIRECVPTKGNTRNVKRKKAHRLEGFEGTWLALFKATYLEADSPRGFS